MDDESLLRQRAREALLSGRLPSHRADRMWGGRGAGTECTVCGKPVRPDETGFELEFAAPDGGSGLWTHALHMRCFACWEFERREAEAVRRAKPVRLNGQPLPEPDGNGTIVACERNVESRGERG